MVGVNTAVFYFLHCGAHWHHPHNDLYCVVTLQETSSCMGTITQYTCNNVISTNYQSESPAISASSAASNSAYSSTPMGAYDPLNHPPHIKGSPLRQTSYSAHVYSRSHEYFIWPRSILAGSCNKRDSNALIIQPLPL